MTALGNQVSPEPVRRHQGRRNFDSLTLRAACLARPGEGLLEVTHHQSEFTLAAETRTLVGFWAPEYAVAGGSFEVDAGRVRSPSRHPGPLAYLAADLSGEHCAEIETAETGPVSASS